MFENMFSGFDPKRITGATGGDQWGTTVQYGSNPLTYSAFNGNVAGIDPGAFGNAAGGVMKDYGASMGGASQSGGSGAFAGPSIQPPTQDMGQAAQAALATQNAAAQQRMVQINQPSLALQKIRGAYDGGL